MNLKQLIVFGLENSQEPVIKNPVLRAALEEPRITAQEPRIELAGGGWLWRLLYKGKPGLQHGAIERKLRKEYIETGMDKFKASEKAMAEASEITRNKKIKIVQDQMNKTNIHDDEYVALIDEYYRLTDYEMYKDIKRWDKTRPALADKTRAIVFPDWAEARYGEDYHTVLERGQTREIQQSIDPNIKEPLSPADQMVSDIDDMNKANLDELLEGRKKNAYGGRIGYNQGGDVDKLIKTYSEEGANSPIRREIKKSLLKNKQFKNFIGEKELKRVSQLESGPKSWTERNLISNFMTHRKHMNMLPDGGKGYISAMKLADKLGIPENTFWNNIHSIKKDYPQYNIKKLNETLKGETLTIDGNNFHYYKDPGKKEVKVLLEYFDRPILGKNTVKGLNAFFDDTEIMKMLDARQFPDIEDAQRVLKAAKLPASEQNAATAMLRLGEVLQGKQFKNKIDIKPNKVLGNYIYKQIDDFDMTHPWAKGVYDAAVREISENMPRQVGSIEKYKTLLKGALPDGFLDKKKLNMNEIFSVRASARNKAYPYAYFIDVIDKDLNQKELAKFHGHLSQAQTNLRNKIGQIRKTKNPRFRKALYKEAQDIVKNFEGTRKTWKNTIKKNYGKKPFNLPNIVLGTEKEIIAKDMKIAENIYKKADLDKWAAKGVDIAGHAKKTGFVMTGAASKTAMLATEFKDPKNVNKMLQAAGIDISGCLSSGGRVNLKLGKGVNTCITGVIDKELALARKSGNTAKFSKFGKLASKAGWIVGWADIPIELAFALPHLLAGNVQDAKAATTAGLFGYGGKRLEQIDQEKNPEAYKYFKHIEDINVWMDAFNQQQDAESKWSNVDEEYVKKYQTEGDPSGVMDRIVDQHDEAVATQKYIQENYQGYVNEEGEEDPRLIDLGKEEGKKYLRETVKKEWKEGMPIRLEPFSNEPYHWAPFKEDKITSLEQQIKQKGESFYGGFMKPGVKAAAERLGAPDLYDDWYDAFYGKDPRDAHSSLPLEWTDQLAELEKKELYQRLADKLMRPGGAELKKSLTEQGFDFEPFREYNLQTTGGWMSEGGRAGYMGGGIMNLKKKW